MKKWAVLIVLMGLGFSMAMITGCEWEGVTDDVSSSDGSDGTNGTGGNTNGTGGNTDGSGTGSVNTNTGLATDINIFSPTEAGRTTYSGVLPETGLPVDPGTMTIDAGGFIFDDDGNGVLIGQVAGSGGFIEYSTGAWSIDLGGDIEAGLTIVGSWSFSTVTTNSP